jgi:hypothetical protein
MSKMVKEEFKIDMKVFKALTSFILAIYCMVKMMIKVDEEKGEREAKVCRSRGKSGEPCSLP